MTEKMPLRTVVGFYAAELFKSVMQSRAFLQKSLKKVNEISIEHYNFDKKCDFEANVMAFYLTHTILFECGNYKPKFLKFD